MLPFANSRDNGPSGEQVVFDYHERTKHHYQRSAASPGHMDWATQPDPFRRYAGAPLIRLPLPANGRTTPYGQLFTADGVPATALSIDSVSLGMFADYMDSLTTYGAVFYRNLFWEAGLIGQALYLEAEAAGIRATGIGCYFDDAVHEVFGMASRAWQSLYHFTVGGPVEDKRLTTLPAYD
jgi:hypothetical protein